MLSLRYCYCQGGFVSSHPYIQSKYKKQRLKVRREYCNIIRELSALPSARPREGRECWELGCGMMGGGVEIDDMVAS